MNLSIKNDHKPKLFTDFSIERIIGIESSSKKSFASSSPPEWASSKYHSNHPHHQHSFDFRDDEYSNDGSFQSFDTALESPSSSSNYLKADQLNNANNKRYRPKNFPCSKCPQAFSNNGQLKTHTRIHTGERPYKCEHHECNKSFTRNEELTRHKLIHTGVRPHACNSCGKRFGRKDHLKKHTKTHERHSQRLLGEGGGAGGSFHNREQLIFDNVFGGGSSGSSHGHNHDFLKNDHHFTHDRHHAHHSHLIYQLPTGLFT